MADPQKVISNNALQEANLLHSPQSNESKERVKWEAQYSPFGPPGRPYVKRDYPMMLYLAGRPENGMGPDCILEQETVDVHESGREEFLRSRGFRETPLDALAAFQGQQLEFAKLAANLEHQKQHMSPKAAAEIDAAQDASATHLPMVPETPIKPRAK